MRRVRGEAGVSLRELENRGAWRRSTISQVENGKARPSRQLVEWYDAELGSDGLLLSIYAEAARASCCRAAATDPADASDDVVAVIDVDPPAGLLVNRGARLQATFTLGNSGPAPLAGTRAAPDGRLRRTRLISSAPETPVPDTAPGEIATVVLTLRAPEVRDRSSRTGAWSTKTGANAPRPAHPSPSCS